MLVPDDKPETNRDSALLSWIQQFAPYGVITLDTSFRVQSWNVWMESHSSLRLADVAGKDLFELFPNLRDRKLAVHLERALHGEPSVLSTALHGFLLPLPAPFRDMAAPQMLQTARIAPLFSQDKVCGLVVVIEDVTQRETQALSLGRQHRRDEILCWALTLLLKTEEPRNVARQLFFKIAEYLDFDTFALYLRDLDTGSLALHAGGGLPLEIEKEFAACPFLAMIPAGTRDLVALTAVQDRTDPEFEVLKRAGIHAAVLLPLFGKDRNLGLLCFATTARESIVPEEADLLTTIAQCLATALDREHTNRQLQSVTEQLSGQAHLLEKTVQERTFQLQATIAELETFSYAVAHDLREPVRGLTGYCEVLIEDFDDRLPPDAKIVVERLARTSRRMEMLTRDLLAFSSISRQQIVLSPVEVEALIENVIALRVPAVRQAITVQLPLHQVLAHRALLQQFLSNLVDNAIKFVAPNAVPKINIWTEVVYQATPNTRSGPLVFSSNAPQPPQSAAPAGSAPARRVRIWIADEGIGIPAQVHPKIFGIFERGLSSELYEGTGMGLAIVARATQRMGGTCGVESEPGKGSRFWVELPEA